MPGTVKKFVLSDYRRELQKDYKRITLYLCKTSDLIISQYPVSNDETIGEEENPAKKSKNTEFYDFDMYLNAIDLPQEDTNLVHKNTNLISV